jgi:hypothetical protein
MYQAVGIQSQRGRVRVRRDTKQILASGICGEDSTLVFRGLESYSRAALSRDPALDLGVEAPTEWT